MLIDIETSSPPFQVTQQKVAEELKKRLFDKPAAQRLIDAVAGHSGIENRFIVVPDTETNNGLYLNKGEFIKPDTKKRMEEYEVWSKKLSKEAVEKLFNKSNFNPNQIDRIITISCTGFFAPGLDYFLMNEFKIPFNAKRTNIGFMGCAAAIVGFNSVLEAMNSAKNSKQNTLLVAIELCSLHLQIEPTRDNILANMIFADGCGAALFSNSASQKAKLDLLFTESVLFNDSEKYMGWKIGNFGFEMILSSELPKIILDEAVPSLKRILNEKGIQPEQIKYWALHPGGRAILDSLQNGLNLSDEKMIYSRNILRNYGNMSSASILFVLKEIINNSDLQKDEFCCAVAFGPGLTMETALFKVL